jgi:Alpha/beta hydrolase domain
VVRALLLAMADWTTTGKAPPPSRWPSLARGELVSLDKLKGPQGFTWAKVMNRPIPPAGRPEWPIHVPVIDADGNDAPGIRLPAVAAPEGTYMGWNLRKLGYGEGDLCLLAGSYLPFARDAASRGGDVRRSVAERGDRAAQMQHVAEALVADRLLLAEDAAKAAR